MSTNSHPTPARAILVATGHPTPFDGGRCSPLTPLVDRPFLQHVVECLVEHEIRNIEFLLCEQADEVEARFVDGSRWGAQFRYHLIRDSERPYGRLKKIVRGNMDAPFLLVHADVLQPASWLMGGAKEPHQERTV